MCQFHIQTYTFSSLFCQWSSHLQLVTWFLCVTGFTASADGNFVYSLLYTILFASYSYDIWATYSFELLWVWVCCPLSRALCVRNYFWVFDASLAIPVPCQSPTFERCYIPLSFSVRPNVLLKLTSKNVEKWCGCHSVRANPRRISMLNTPIPVPLESPKTKVCLIGYSVCAASIFAKTDL